MPVVWKRAYLVRRNPRLSAAEFPLRWKQHSELGMTFPDVVRRNQRLAYCLVDHAAGERIGADRDYDGIGMLWLRSPELLDAPSADPTAVPTMRADELKVFHQHAFASSVMLEENVLADGPPARVAVLTFVKRRADLSREAFRAAWVQAGAQPVAGALAGKIRRRVRSTAVLDPTIAFDGLAEMWFDHRDDAVAGAGSDDGGQELTEPAASMRFLTEICHERVS